MTKTKDGAYAALSRPQQKFVDALNREHGDELVRRAKLDILLEKGNEALFLHRYFGDRLDAKLEPFHMRLIDTALNDPRGLVLFPAGHGKTTLISGMLPILEICRNPNVRIAIIAKNDNEASAIMSSIKAELENNVKLIADYGPFRPVNGDPMRVWLTEAISVSKRTRQGKEHTLAVFGAGSRQILGWRTDWVIMDDTVTERNSATEDQRIKHVQWFNDCVSTSPEKKKAGVINGRITAVGTMFHPHDLYATITSKLKADGTPMYHSHREDAILDYEKKLPLWPDVWSWGDLMNVKAAEGTLSFNKRYRNRPVDESMQPFREEYLLGDPAHPGCLHDEYVLGEVEEGWRVFQSFDPAVGKTRSAKFCGHIVFAIDPAAPRRRHIIEVNRDQLTVPQQRDRLIDTHLKYNCVLSITEENAYQAGLKQIVDERCEQLGVTLRFEGHTTGRNKQDPEIGLPSLAPLCENGDLWLPTGNPESRRKSMMLVEELVEYPFFKYSDLLMALWFGHLRASEVTASYVSFNRLDPKSRYRRSNGRKGIVRNPYFEKSSTPDLRVVS